jgi:L-seryl-tRNA(Ser) seleniumtransferase
MHGASATTRRTGAPKDPRRALDERLSGISGLRAELSPDPTGNPITRLRLYVDASAGITAWDFADALAKGERPVIVRDDEIAQGNFELDPCNLSDSEAEEVAERIIGELRSAQTPTRLQASFAEWSAKRMAARLAWPDRTA